MRRVRLVLAGSVVLAAGCRRGPVRADVLLAPELWTMVGQRGAPVVEGRDYARVRREGQPAHATYLERETLRFLPEPDVEPGRATLVIDLRYVMTTRLHQAVGEAVAEVEVTEVVEAACVDGSAPVQLHAAPAVLECVETVSAPWLTQAGVAGLEACRDRPCDTDRRCVPGVPLQLVLTKRSWCPDGPTVFAHTVEVSARLGASGGVNTHALVGAEVLGGRAALLR